MKRALIAGILLFASAVSVSAMPNRFGGGGGGGTANGLDTTSSTQTKSGGLNVSGTVTAGKFAGDGSGLTGLSAAGAAIRLCDTAGTCVNMSTMMWNTAQVRIFTAGSSSYFEINFGSITAQGNTFSISTNAAGLQLLVDRFNVRSATNDARINGLEAAFNVHRTTGDQKDFDLSAATAVIRSLTADLSAATQTISGIVTGLSASTQAMNAQLTGVSASTQAINNRLLGGAVSVYEGTFLANMTTLTCGDNVTCTASGSTVTIAGIAGAGGNGMQNPATAFFNLNAFGIGQSSGLHVRAGGVDLINAQQLRIDIGTTVVFSAPVQFQGGGSSGGSALGALNKAIGWSWLDQNVTDYMSAMIVSTGSSNTPFAGKAGIITTMPEFFVAVDSPAIPQYSMMPTSFTLREVGIYSSSNVIQIGGITAHFQSTAPQATGVFYFQNGRVFIGDQVSPAGSEADNMGNMIADRNLNMGQLYAVANATAVSVYAGARYIMTVQNTGITLSTNVTINGPVSVSSLTASGVITSSTGFVVGGSTINGSLDVSGYIKGSSVTAPNTITAGNGFAGGGSTLTALVVTTTGTFQGVSASTGSFQRAAASTFTLSGVDITIVGGPGSTGEVLKLLGPGVASFETDATGGGGGSGSGSVFDPTNGTVATSTFSAVGPYGPIPWSSANSASTATVFGTTNPYRTIPIPASAWYGVGPSSASPGTGGFVYVSTPQTAYNMFGEAYHEFNAPTGSTPSWAMVNFTMPFEWDGSSVGFLVDWFASTGQASTNCGWSLGGIAMSSGAAVYQAITSSATAYSTWNSSNTNIRSTISPEYNILGNPKPGDRVKLVLTASGGGFRGLPRMTGVYLVYRESVWDGRPR